jgi:serine-type D-Ala-D-Ala carboxypeptidase (penicillin-binding protein 5/6)
VGPPSSLLMEVSTGRILASADPHRQRPPASLDKLMTFYLALQAIKGGHLALTSQVMVSRDAWRIGRTPGSSRMFLNVGDDVTVAQLLSGLMVASGNDAAEALAEAIAGSPEQFVEEMNGTAARLGMRDTHFVSAHGLPTPGEYTSAWDMGLLARQLLLTFPNATTYSSPRYTTYAGIRQANWNNLVFRDPYVDGLKTGYTESSGFHIVATAKQGSMRLIAIVMGAKTLRQRTAAAEAMLTTGFGRYELVPVAWQQIVPGAITVYGGTSDRLTLATPHPVAVLLPRDDHTALSISEELRVAPLAPFRQGQPVGLLTIRTGSTVLLTSPLVAAAAIGRGSALVQGWGMFRYHIDGLFHRRPQTWTGTFTPGQ